MADTLQFTAQIVDAVAQSLTATVAQAVQEAGRGAGRQVQAMAEIFERNLGNPGDLKAAHERVALLAQDSVKRSFDQVVKAREGWAGRQHYRPGASDWHSRRFAGGVLRAALGSPDFFGTSAQGIDFGNISMLNRRAGQWHRLNFGAGNEGTGATQRFQVTWGNLVVGTLGFDEGASPGFVVPVGVWLGPEGPVRSGAFAAGSDMFFPSSEVPAGAGRFQTRRARPTQGIVARNFLDAGLRRIGQELPVAYGQLYQEWWDQAQAGSGPLTSVASVVPARPVTLRSKVRTL